MVALSLAAVPVRAFQPEPLATAAEKGITEKEEKHEDSVLNMVARVVNFGLLAGALVYFLRSPFAKYLADRGQQIRSDLVTAAEMKRNAAAQIEDIDRRMKALPAELEALRAQGAQEIAAEEARIRTAAAAERELVNHAADLAVGVATERIKKNITDDDRQRLVDRYVQQLKS